ncbi:MAG: hypothetical protein P8M22_01580 [Phycisphaerales bacterium]|nr:hypothetical protein [Phycisphaerales bacterium]
MSAGAITVELGSSRLRAVEAVPTKQGIRIVKTLVGDIPSGLDRTQPMAVGEWIGSQLSEAGFKGNRCIVALPREDVVLKRMNHPTTDLDELPDMTRLAMERELPFDHQAAIIDFVVLNTGDTTTTVLAAALPGESLERVRQMTTAAGLIMQSVSLRTFGAATIIDPLMGTGTEAVAIDLIPGDGIEFTFIRDGHVQFSRAARLAGVDEEAIIGAAVRESQRTWLSRQMDDEEAKVNFGVVLGPKDIAEQVATRVGSLFKTPVELVESQQRIQASSESLDRHWSLAGLLLAHATNHEMIDFASPRQAPDPMAGHRKLALGGVAILLILVLIIYTIGNLQSRSLQASINTLQDRQAILGPDFLRYHRDRFRLGHLDYWDSVGVNWISHLQNLDGLRPVPEQLVLDEIAGSLNFDGVTRDRAGTWDADWAMGLTINGESSDRAMADALREQLVQTMTYTTSSAGNDTDGGRRLPHGFTYRLRTVTADPAVTDGTSGDGS